MLILNVDGHTYSHNQNPQITLLEWIDTFIKAYDQIPAAKASTFTVVALGPFMSTDMSQASEMLNLDGYHIHRPLQSWQSPNSSPSSFFTVSHRLQGVTRRDNLHLLAEFSHFHQGAYCCMPLDRLIPDIAYKLGCSQKYGS